MDNRKSKSERLNVTFKGPLRILGVGDVHAPYTHQGRADETVKFAKDFRATHIVQIGDVHDQYAHSKYAKSLNVMTPIEEDDLSQKYAVDFWKRLQSASPNAACYQLKGNHDVRAYKRVLERAPDLEQAVMEFYDKLTSFKGVRTLADDRSELVINGVLFIHGYLANLGDHLRLNRQSTVVGHSHRGGVVFQRVLGSTLFELNCGHIADESLLPSAYQPQRTSFWTPGIGAIETLKNGVVAPRFIPL